MFGALLIAIKAASIKKVPEPHIGSINCFSCFQLLSKIIPAAKTSFIGAWNFFVRYPLLCSDAPELFNNNVHSVSEICMWILKSGLFKSIDGRSFLYCLNWSTIASFTIKETYLLCVKYFEFTVEETLNVLSGLNILYLNFRLKI